MKIAVVTEDKVHVGEHFGGSPYIVVATVEAGEIVNREERHNPGHDEFATEEHHPQTSPEGTHGFGSEAEKRHKMQLDIIEDCDVLVVDRMGTGAYNLFTDAGIKVIATDVKEIDKIFDLFASGELSEKNPDLD